MCIPLNHQISDSSVNQNFPKDPDSVCVKWSPEKCEFSSDSDAANSRTALRERDQDQLIWELGGGLISWRTLSNPRA